MRLFGSCLLVGFVVPGVLIGVQVAVVLWVWGVLMYCFGCYFVSGVVAVCLGAFDCWSLWVVICCFGLLALRFAYRLIVLLGFSFVLL